MVPLWAATHLALLVPAVLTERVVGRSGALVVRRNLLPAWAITVLVKRTTALTQTSAVNVAGSPLPSPLAAYVARAAVVVRMGAPCRLDRTPGLAVGPLSWGAWTSPFRGHCNHRLQLPWRNSSRH